MIEKKFTILHGSDDLSLILRDFTTASKVVPLLQNENIEIGFYKPFNFFHIELVKGIDNIAQIGFEYFDGTLWKPLNVSDETFQLRYSGFVSFVKPSDWKHASDNLFKVRMKASDDTNIDLEFKGINVIFSNDKDIIGIRENIVSKHSTNGTWVAKHESARNYMIKLLNNQGHVKIADNSADIFGGAVYRDEITQFDFIDPRELALASAYKALSMIYMDELSDEADDKWYRRGKRYENDFTELFNNFMLKLDTNDDGVNDDYELDNDTHVELSWV